MGYPSDSRGPDQISRTVKAVLPRANRATGQVWCSGDRGSRPRDHVPGVFIRPDQSHEGDMGRFQDEDADAADIFRGEKQPQRSQECERNQIERRHEICKASRGAALEDIDGILEQILFTGVGHDLNQSALPLL